MSVRTEEHIVDLIARRHFAPGERLVEADLARLFGTSRVPIREALRTLETQGIVTITPHRGAHVTVFDEVRIARVAEARFALELIATRDAIRRLAKNPALIQGIDEVISRMREMRKRDDRMSIYRADIDFHTEVARISGNDVVAKLWGALSRHVLIAFGHLTERYPDLDAIVRTHLDLRAFLLAGKVTRLERTVAEHIGGLDPVILKRASRLR
jgi:DNA-binding GntR family transcriptional regulator